MGYGNCGCGPGWGGRRYFTKEEQKEYLENYKEALENELKGIKERLSEMSK